MKPRSLLFLASLVVLGAVSWFVACSPAAQQPPLKVGLVNWPVWQLFHLAEEERFFEGDRVRLIYFDSLTDLSRAARAGEVDAWVSTLKMFLRDADDGFVHRMILITDFSRGGDALVARPGFESVSSLQGARIGLESTDLGRYMLLHALESASMSMEDVRPVYLAEDELFEAFTGGLVDAIVCYDPVRQRLLGKGGQVVFDSSKIPTGIVDILATRKEIIESHPDELRLLAESYFRAREYLLQRPTETARRLAAHCGLTPEEFLETLQGVHLTDEHENDHLLAGENEAFLRSVRDAASFIHEQGGLGSIPEPTSMMTNTFIPPHPEREHSPPASAGR